ncbi:MAG: molybdenum cofactor guanylyltransferase [Gammaproteobacteria bacterium]|nr:molybdenum cofactor guanylyltransferase [Gammaproteobacteria bacterium]
MSPEAQDRSSAARLAGVVLAGGRSVRFGGEKAAALLAGKPLVLWAVERLREVCAQVAVNARPGSEAQALARAAGLEVLHDLPGDAAGPLAGVRAGLIWAAGQGAEALAVSPCDAPLLPADLYPRLIAAAGAGAAMAETADGPQPLCAVWPVGALGALTAALAGGAHPATWRMLEEIGAQRVHFAQAGDFVNLNTREELAALAARFAQR